MWVEVFLADTSRFPHRTGCEAKVADNSVYANRTNYVWQRSITITSPGRVSVLVRQASCARYFTQPVSPSISSSLMYVILHKDCTPNTSSSPNTRIHKVYTPIIIHTVCNPSRNSSSSIIILHTRISSSSSIIHRICVIRKDFVNDDDEYNFL